MARIALVPCPVCGKKPKVIKDVTGFERACEQSDLAGFGAGHLVYGGVAQTDTEARRLWNEAYGGDDA